MTNKLVIIINSLKVPKILLYEMKFLVHYSCLQNPWLGGYRPQIPVLSVVCPQLNLLKPRTKFLGTPLPYIILSHGRTVCILDTVSSNNKNHLFVDHLRVWLKTRSWKRWETHKQGSLYMSLPEESESSAAFY